MLSTLTHHSLEKEQIKILRYHFTPIKSQVFKKLQILRADKNVEKQALRRSEDVRANCFWSLPLLDEWVQSDICNRVFYTTALKSDPKDKT